MDRWSSHRAQFQVVFGWCALSLMIGCSDPAEEKGEDDPDEEQLPDCEGAACASNTQPTDWSAEVPVYAAHLVVSDEGGNPIANARVQVKDRVAMTDAAGVAVVSPIEVQAPAKVQVQVEGKTPYVAQTDVSRSGQKNDHVTLLPLAVSKDIDPQQRVIVGDEKANVDLPPRALTKADGTRPTQAKVELATQHPKDLPPSARIGSKEAIDRTGQPTLIEEVQTVVYVRFKDPSGEELNLAPGQLAQMELVLPEGVQAPVGQKLPLWYLDEQTAQWKEDSSCIVSERDVGGVTKLVCQGAVSHFSYWSIAKTRDITQPNSVGCLNVTANVHDLGECRQAEIEGWTLGHCDAAGNCFPTDSWWKLMQARRGPNVCGVTPIDHSYRLAVAYHVSVASDCASADAKKPRSTDGRRIMVTDPFTIDTFQSVLGSDFMLGFMYNQERDCDELCKQLPIEITEASNSTSFTWVDADNDGWFVTSTPLGFAPATDCDDANSGVHPEKAEPFCVTGDLDCDGVAAGGVKTAAAAGISSWNTWCAWCRDHGGIETSPEVPGNYLDEDCMEGAVDMDADGEAAPDDCNDGNSTVNTAAAEVPGNYADENCDGFVQDTDGDGYYNALSSPLAEELGLDPLLFSDCDDTNPEARPDADPAHEIDALGPYFRANPANAAEIIRKANYCTLFAADGTPTWRFYQVAPDLNCDTYRSDLDGDGYTAIGDTTFDTETSIVSVDCDDLDPRIGPAPEDQTCPVPPDFGALNETGCIPVAPKCPAVDASGVTLPTTCGETLDAMGNPTGMGVCAYLSWPEGNPLSIEPGKLWGPCDGDGPIPECPTGSTCGGPLMYTATLTNYLQANYTEGMPLHFKGMCFPSCTP